MGAKRLSISIPEEQDQFLAENPGISASNLLQEAIAACQRSIRNNPQLVQALKEVENARRLVDTLKREIQKGTEFITMKGDWEEYVKWNTG